ncbi:MAG: helix-turn-helix domain-containing protein [Sulfurimonas sp.]|nr:helix-turn-helix domain-containing protein [Sulfurimonas sp.]
MQSFPLISIEQTLNTYKELHSKNPSFGMDTYAKDFKPDDFVILTNNGKGSKGIPIRCAHYTCILALKGGSIRHVNQYDYTITAQSLQLLVPGAIHSFEDTQANSEFIVLIFNPEFLPQEVEELLAFHNKYLQSVDLDCIEFKNVLNIYEQLNIEYKNLKSDYKEIAKHLLIQLLYILKREKLAKPKIEIKNRGQQISNKFLSLIEEHFQEYKSVKSYADILNITPKHLSETIKDSLGKSALHFIHKRIIKEVQYLLCYSDMSIKQISSNLNFENSSDLGRFFKRYEGLSPNAYRLHFHN